MRIIFASHGNLARAMISSVQMISGGTGDITAVGLYPDDGFDEFKDRIESLIKDVGDDELLVLTDLFYGSPFNAVTQLMGKYRFAHITGSNLAILLEVIMSKDDFDNSGELKAHVMELAGNSIIDVNDCLERMDDE